MRRRRSTATLISINPDNPSSSTDFVCDLCTEMPKPTDDGKTYTFKIRKGVKFHDGTPLTAADVATSWQHIVNPPKGVSSAREAYMVMVDTVDEPRSRDRRVQAEVRHRRLPAGAGRSLRLHLQEGHRWRRIRLVREERPGVGPVQVRRLRDRPVDQGRAQPGLLSRGPALPRRLRRHLRGQAVGPRRCHPRRPCRHRVPRHAAVGPRRAGQGAGRQGHGPDQRLELRQPADAQPEEEAVRRRAGAARAGAGDRSRGRALRRCPRSPPFIPSAAWSSPARRWRRPRRSCRRSSGFGRTSRSRGPRPGSS